MKKLSSFEKSRVMSSDDEEDEAEDAAVDDADDDASFFSSLVVISLCRFFAVYKSFVVFKISIAIEGKVYIELIITHE